jgi:diacylglycerol O-acyltransferase / wax synthase
MMMVDLATNEADPVAALQAIARSSLAAKGLTADLAAGFDAEVSLPGMPRTLQNAAALVDFTGLADLPAARMPCNLVVSNVPGPQQQLFCCGARVLTHYPVSIPAHGQAVNITVQSYAGQMFFSITACAKALPDADRLRDDIVSSFAQLMERHGVVPEVTTGADEESGAGSNGVVESEPVNVAMQKIPGRGVAARRDRNSDDTQTKAA